MREVRHQESRRYTAERGARGTLETWAYFVAKLGPATSGVMRIAAAFTWLTCFAIASRAPAEPVMPSLPTGGIWLVSSREPAVCDAAPCALRYARFDGANWHQATHEEFLAAQRTCRRTFVSIHGYNTEPDEACEHGLWTYEQLARWWPQPVSGSFVIWSWPSDREQMPLLEDIRQKAVLAEIQGFQLACWLRRLCPGSEVAIAGHSYGARLATAALHLRGGGTLSGIDALPPCDACGQVAAGGVAHTEGERSADVKPGETTEDNCRCGARLRLRLVLTGAALDSHWVLPSGRHGRALSQTQRTLVVFNPSDAALRLYPRLFGKPGPPALGATGVPPESARCPERMRVFEWNISAWIGKAHVSRRYYSVPLVACRIAEFLADCPAAEQPRAGLPPWHVSQQPSKVLR